MKPNENFGMARRSSTKASLEPISLAPIIATPQGPLFTWEQAVRVLRKRRRVALFSAAVMILTVLGAAFLLRDTYQPTARLEIDPPSSGIKTLHEIEYSSETDNQDYLETQAQILQSEALGMRVVRLLHLDHNPEFVTEYERARFDGAAPSASNSNLAGQQQTKESTFLKEQFDLADRTPLESIALGVFKKRLSVSPMRNSRLIEISYASHEPRLAQLITNTLVTQFMDQNYQSRYVSTMEASEWLSAQLNDLREKVQESSQAVADYQRKFGFIDADDKDVPMAQYMAEMNHQLGGTQAARIEQEAYVRMIDMGQAGSIPALREDQVYQNLMTRYADSRAQLAQARTIYGDENSNVKKIENESNELAAQVEAERTRMANQVRTSFAATRDREEMMLRARDRVLAKMGETSSHMVEYHVLKSEALATAELYNTLQARLREAGIYAGLRSSNIHIVDLASRLQKPTSPHRGAIIAIGSIVSCILALMFAFVKESFNNTVRTPDDIRTWVSLPSLAMLPPICEQSRSNVRRSVPIGTLNGGENTRNGFAALPRILSNGATLSAESEAMRNLRTALTFSRDGAPPQAVLVASSSAREGKTTVAINMAATYANSGKTVVVDGDLRQPMIARTFGVRSTPGLGDVLNGTATLEEVLQGVPDIPNLSILPAGAPSRNPFDQVSSDQMGSVVLTLREMFDHIVIDSAPVIPYSDARILASLTDVVVLVARYGVTTRRALIRCADLLEEVGAPVVGVVLNDINTQSPDYQYYNYGFSRSMNGHSYYETGKQVHQGTPNGPRPPVDEPKKKSAHA